MIRFFFLIMLFSLPIVASEPKTDAIFPRTDRKTIGILYEMLKVIDTLFTEHNITYWIDHGTALGATRHHGIIPWDDDADVVYYIKDTKKIMALAKKFAEYGYYLCQQDIIRLFPSKTRRTPFVDIAGFTLCDDNKLRFDSLPSRFFFEKAYWLPEEVSPLVRVKFGPITLSAPNNMLRYLHTTYGEDCLTKAVYKSHTTFKIITEKVDIVDFRPAPYKPVNKKVDLSPTP